MEQDPAQQIEQRLAELPADIRAAIQSADLDKKLTGVGAKNKLHVDQIEELQNEVYLVMLGFSDVSMFAGRLSEELHITPEAAQQLSADINTELFMPIRESMKKFAERPVAPPDSVSKKSVPVEPNPDEQKSGLPVPADKTGTRTGDPRTFGKQDLAKPELHAAELMLTGKTVSVAPKAPAPAPSAPVMPVPYKTDPYREPPE